MFDSRNKGSSGVSHTFLRFKMMMMTIIIILMMLMVVMVSHLMLNLRLYSVMCKAQLN